MPDGYGGFQTSVRHVDCGGTPGARLRLARRHHVTSSWSIASTTATPPTTPWSTSGRGPPPNYHGGEPAGACSTRSTAGYFDDLGINTLLAVIACRQRRRQGDGHRWPLVTRPNHGLTAVGPAEDRGARRAASPCCARWSTPRTRAPHDGHPRLRHEPRATARGPVLHRAPRLVLADPPPPTVATASAATAARGTPSPTGCAAGSPTTCPTSTSPSTAARSFSVENAHRVGDGLGGRRLSASTRFKHIEDPVDQGSAQPRGPPRRSGAARHFYMIGETYTGDKSLIKASSIDPTTELDGPVRLFPLRATVVSTVPHAPGLDDRPRQTSSTAKRRLLRQRRGHGHLPRQPRPAALHSPRPRTRRCGPTPGPTEGTAPGAASRPLAELGQPLPASRLGLSPC